MRILEAKGVTKCFGGLTAVNNVDFHIDTGEIVSLIGPNGAGKTTFFNSITGIYEPTSGDVEFLGEKVKKAKPYEITKLGIGRTFQNIRLFSTMTVMENIMVGQYCRTSSNLLATILKSPKLVKEEKMVIEKTNDIMEFLEISHLKDEIAISLPYGFQRRVEIGRAMATDPKLLLLDEPAAGMNTGEKVEMTRLIKKIRDRGNTILVIEHDMKLVMGISDRIVVLDYGNKIAEGLPHEIQNNEKVITAYLGTGGDK